MRNLLINILLLFVIFPSFALENSFDLSFSHINKGDGLSDDMVFSIFQDSSGYIWIGTSNGLNRYDGYNITNFFHKPDSPTLLLTILSPRSVKTVKIIYGLVHSAAGSPGSFPQLTVSETIHSQNRQVIPEAQN